MAIARRLVTLMAALDLAVLGGGAIAAAVKDDGSSAKASSAPPKGVAAPTTGAAVVAPTSAAASSATPSAVGPPTSAASSVVRPSAARTSAAPASPAPASAPTAVVPPVGSVKVGTSAPATHPTSVRPKPSASAGASHPVRLAAAPGTYPETTSGTLTIGGGKQDASGSATLVVDPAHGSDQEQSSKSDQSSTDEIARFGSDGSVKLTFLHIANQAFDETFHFPSPVPLLPAHPTAGMGYSWTATSDSGKTTLAATGTVKGAEDVTIGGTVVHCLVVHASLKMSGATNVTVDQTVDYAPAYKLIVRERQIASGKYSVVSYTADITTTLVRLTPQ